MRRRPLLAAAALLWPVVEPVLAQVPAPASSAASAAADKGGPPPPVGSALPLPAVTLLDGARFEPAQADGKLLVVYWWATWCPFCAMQSPHMEKLWQAGRGRGLQMLTLAIDKRADDAVKYLARRGYSFPAGLVTPDIARVLPKPKGLPVTIVRGRDGRVLMAEVGQLFPEDVEQIARWL